MKIYIPFILLIFFGCNSPVKQNEATLISDIRLKMIDAILQKQQEAWNNGNLEGFMQYYWKNDSLKFIGKKGVTYGWQNVLDNYKNAYPDKVAMGQLEFNIISTEQISPANLFQVGQWTLSYSDTSDISGHFSLLWQKKEDRWVIVADHSS